MSKSEKKWRRFYMMMYIFIYGIYVPYNLFMWLGGSEGFPYAMLGIALGLPMMKKNHINNIREKEQNIIRK
ncbi:hypothetical protein IHV12_22055 [Fictibacillus sp. 7GRE50]|uniref:hypothetical protein n=1 Tax=unclassified Fictibacillus TaxID=2644029 RepID=UPI0018CDBF22|nr:MULTISPECIES: hypothetical protein [unclassified Fictibacillus]MBH0167596.1 hypothetical protein [Fictibacillus sp. 7GRE50]MBH0176149.1 hypothetical protein [Fictibacillus sp. 23RED33]